MLVSVAHPAQADAALLLVPAPGKLIPEQRAAAQLPRKRDGFTLAACFLQLLRTVDKRSGSSNLGPEAIGSWTEDLAPRTAVLATRASTVTAIMLYYNSHVGGRYAV